ncbi:hypothetical protein QW71_05085 [Paenibacillus sp. IHB B 3415]|uniref:winged helix-turn-helix domain-containing protein n=1 Tax=Paenibacillus sp. IHB B 3415 TaxID=867080 RepID=UPI0005751156|nr:winged helix-turn-helix domain-containing protein [Paenibacillus sp. IHB B 3415]KHL96775.1 hypothetical protein QW71_05085 [Paenibacillus sp. IHB B 3415]
MKTQWVDMIPKRILILHSERMISDLLSFGLMNQGYIVNIGAYTAPGLTLPICDLLIVDSMLRKDKQSEIEVYWRSAGSPPIIEIIKTPSSFLTQDVFTGFVRDHIQVPIEFPELIRKIELILSRYTGSASKLQVSSQTKAYRFRDVEVYIDRFEIERNHTVLSLGKTELYIFIKLLQHESRYVTLDYLENICIFDLQISSRTIQEHILKLRKKLAIFHGGMEIKNLRKRGYRLVIHNREEQA